MKKNRIIVFLLFIIFSVSFLNAEGDQNRKKEKLYKTNGQPEYAIININNISTFLKNDGEADINSNGNSGFYFPNGSNKAVFYQSGFLYGGKVNGHIRVGGSTYNQGQVPGRIISEGVAEDPELPHVRIYRVRRDYKTADLSNEIIIKSDTINNRPTYSQYVSSSEAYSQYEKDWNEWPAVYGAPFEDRNFNGIYEPSIDIPGVVGADLTIWFVCNDLDPVVSKMLYGSPPIGLEMQMTAWGYKGNEILANTVFKKYILINKSGKTITDMYVSMWSDPDLGDGSDDFVGCDTTINLAYVYNGDDYDATYGEQIPATGFKLIQGPLVNGKITDKGKQFGKILNGKKNLKYYAFSFYVSSDPVYNDPRLGDDYDETIMMYNNMQGKIGINGQSFIDPINYVPVRFPLSGDPISKNGWIDGLLHSPGDRRMMASSGPFEMSVGDTQEVIYAQIAAIGNDRLESLKLLRYYSSLVDSARNYQYSIALPQITGSYNGINDNIYFEWDKSSESKSFDNYEFQGYKVYQFSSNEIINKYNGTEISIFDKKDGVKEINGIVMDTSSGFPLNGIVYKGKDSGIFNNLEIEKDYIKKTNFIIGNKYYFGVASYYFDPINNNTIESPASIIKAIYKGNYTGSKIGDIITVRKTKGIGSANLNIEIDDPAKITGHDYKIWFTSIDNAIKWNLADNQTGEEIISNKDLRGYYRYPYNIDNNQEYYSIIDGLKIFIEYGSEPISNIEVVSNKSGKLIPTEGGAFPEAGFPSIFPTERQQVGNGIWLFHTADNGGTFNGGSRKSYKSFLNRTFRFGNIQSFINLDWEMRFTNEGSYSLRAYQDGKVVYVPFELWCIGNGTPDDPSDDYRLIPWMIDNGEDFSYNLESWGQSSTNPSGNYEHSVSDGNDDPFTDWIYWMQPRDKSPGSSGYDAFVTLLDLVNNTDGTYDYGGQEVIARTVLVNLNGGSKPPFNQDLPEIGTTFRITSGKYVKPGEDEYEFSTTSIENYLTDVNTKNNYSLSQNYPNPFNSTTRIKYKIPIENLFGIKSVPVKLIIYDILGRQVTKLVDTVQPPGEYEVSLNTSYLSSGIYIYYLSAGNFKNVKKMVLLK